MRKKLVTVLLPQSYLNMIDDLVRAGLYDSRSEAIRGSVRTSMIEGEIAENNFFV